jgi:alkylation response protein AidB-like acyl-CoA dehydrogenase
MHVDPAQRARAFVHEVVKPNLAAWERSANYPRDAVAASGLTGIFSPAADGGLDLTFAEAIAVFEELGRGDAALAFSLSMHNAVASAIIRAGSEELRARWAQPLVSGEALGCFSLTEPHAGSDATAITTRATPGPGDTWRLTGTKAWVSLGGVADVYVVIARTSDQPGHSDIAMFVLDGAEPGIMHSAPYDKAAASFLPITEMELGNASGRLLIPPGEGIRAALGAIDVARFDIAAISHGLHAEALDIAGAYAARRHAFGRPLLEHQGLAFALADVATELEAARGLTRRAAELIGTRGGPVAVAHAKRFGPDVALRGAIACSEVLGAYGWLNEYPLSRFIALAKMLQVVDGTAEIQRVVIARELSRRAAAASRDAAG